MMTAILPTWNVFFRQPRRASELVAGDSQTWANGLNTLMHTMRQLMRLVETEQTADFLDMTKRVDFKKWFRGSKIVDVNGAPLLVWHGLKQPMMYLDRANKRVLSGPDFQHFEVLGGIEPGAWFSPDPTVARHYGEPAPFFLRARNPVRIEAPISEPPAGHDAVYRTRSSGTEIWQAWEIAVFNRAQVRLAFDPAEMEKFS